MKILYGLASEGMGHAIRSKVLLSKLVEKHDIKVICSGKVYDLLSKDFDCEEIVGTVLSYKDNGLDFFRTIKENVKKWPDAIPKNAEILWKIIKEFDPDIVITDFESLSSFYSDISAKKLISIDNMQIMDKCEVDYPKEERTNYEFTRRIVGMRIPRADHYIITTFFYAEVKEKFENKVSLVSPILRVKILDAATKFEDHVLVYQTSKSNKELGKILNKIDEDFIVYGFDIDKKDGNVEFKKFSEEGFVKDLASCKAVILNGGFTTIGEALYLGKPILSVPIQNHFEQILNAYYVDKLGYGKYEKEVSQESVGRFLEGLSEYRENLKEYNQEGNKEYFRIVEKMLEEFGKSQSN